MLAVAPPFEGHVLAAEVFAKRYSAAIGRSVTVASEVRNFPVFVVTNGGTPETVLRLVAKGLHATFRKDAGGYVITRTPEDRRQLNAQYTALNRRIVAEEIARFGADLTIAKRWGDPVNQFEAALVRSTSLQQQAAKKPVDMEAQMPPDEFTPAGHLLYRVLKQLGPEAFETLPPFESRVFSNRPTTQELPLHLDPIDLDTFANEFRDFARSGVFIRQKSAMATGHASPAAAPNLTEVDPDGLTVVLSTYRRREYIEFYMSVFDVNGKRIAISAARTIHRVFGGNFTNVLPTILGRPDVEWTPLTPKVRRFARALHLRLAQSLPAESTDPAGKPDLPSSLAEYIAVDKAEPMANLFDDLLSAEAKKDRTKPFITAIPDLLWNVGTLCQKPTGLVQDAFRPLAEGPFGDCEYLESAEGTVVRPRNPVLSESMDVDRTTMARVYRDFIRQVPVSLESWLRSMGDLHDHYDPVNRAFLEEFRRRQNIRIVAGFEASPEFYDLIGHVLERFPRLDAVPAGYELNTPQDHNRLIAFLTDFLRIKGRGDLPDEARIVTKLLGSGSESVKLTLVHQTQPLIQCTAESSLSQAVGMPFEDFAATSFMGPTAPDRAEFDAGISSRYDKPETRIAVTSREVLEVVFDLPRGIRQTLEIRNEPVPPTQGWRFADVPKKLWDELFRITTRVKNGQKWIPAENPTTPTLPVPPPQ